MAGKANIWIGKWPERAYELATSVGTVEARIQLSKEMGRDISSASLQSFLRCHYPTWHKEYLNAKINSDPLVKATDPLAISQNQVRALREENNSLKRSVLSEELVRQEIFKLSTAHLGLPAWVSKVPALGISVPGVPTVLNSDDHWGEVVDPAQVNGVNFYDLDEARNRLRTFTENTLDLLFKHTVNPRYPGIVVCYAGDGVTGDIHEELTATNECETMPALVDLVRHKILSLNMFLDNFENVLVVGVTGNHGRNTHKIRAKGRAYTNFDWLCYQMLMMHYGAPGNKLGKRIKFIVPAGPDALFPIYNHKYLLTHGDKLGHGGDGIIGALGPIIRGDHKKRSRNSQIGMVYDTLLCGHWHQYIPTQRIIVNGSLKGLDEYAWGEGYPYEVPQQALWLTHPERGITFQMPVAGIKKSASQMVAWSSWDKVPPQ
jgi:hypothetical protein